MARPARSLPMGEPPASTADWRETPSLRVVEEPMGPFRAEHVRDGDHYEVSRGHAIKTMAGSGRHAAGAGLGFEVIDSDPAVPGAGVDLGFSPEDATLRAPDVAVTPHTDAEGWVKELPTLAIEYAGKYQNELELTLKIRELLDGGTKHLWVVRLMGKPRVEVHEPGKPMRLAWPGEQLDAPGVLQNPVLVEALWDRKAAHEHTLRNLMQRKGYADLETALASARAEGEAQGEARGEAQGEARAIGALSSAILASLDARGLSVPASLRARVLAMTDLPTLQRWLMVAVSGQPGDLV